MQQKRLLEPPEREELPAEVTETSAARPTLPSAPLPRPKLAKVHRPDVSQGSPIVNAIFSQEVQVLTMFSFSLDPKFLDPRNGALKALDSSHWRHESSGLLALAT